jgi:D-glycero-D-manno-heptose 1,7-bisphosphate phosphatase
MRGRRDTAAPRRAALFLDRDGTLIRDRGYLDRADGVERLPGAREALRRAHRTHRLFLFSNQSGVSRGYFTWAQVDAVNRRLFRLLGNGERLFDACCMAAEHPDAPAVYRKPSPRFILECIDQFALDPGACWMVGDRLSDLQAGLRAGVRAALVTSGGAIDPALADYLRSHAVPAFASLAECIAAIQRGPRRPRAPGDGCDAS